MAVDIYLTIGDVKGPVMAMNYKGWIELESCNWGLNRTRQAGDGAKPARAVTTGNTLSATKLVGMESTGLMNLCASGKVCDSAKISIAPAVSKREVAKKYILLTMTGAFIKSINAASMAADSTLTEELVIGFKQLSFEYFIPTNRDSAASDKAADSRTFTFDFATQVASEQHSDAAPVVPE